jgi:dTMP kinase
MAFIAVEGIDGAGLSTQTVRLAEWLNKKGKHVLATKEPTNGAVGGIIRAAVSKEWSVSPHALQLLFAADRAQHLRREIEPALKSGKTVICDRYTLSSLAYGSLDMPLDWLKQINESFRKPDLTILLDAHPRITLERLKQNRTKLELFENEAKLQQVRQNYLNLRSFFKEIVLVDANKPFEEVALEIQKAVARRM